MKIKGTMLRIGHGIREMLPSIAVGTGLGMIVGGYFGSIANGIAIKKQQRQINSLGTELRGLEDTFNNNVTVYNSFVDWTHENVGKLQSQNNVLLERALKETEGKG